MARFARSPEGSAVLKKCDRFGWAALVVDYGMRHRGVNIARMHRTDLDQTLFEVLPREFSARAEDGMDASDEALGGDQTAYEGNEELMDDELFDEGGF